MTSVPNQVREHSRGVGLTLFINWPVKPFSMAALAWLFIGHWFAPIVGLLLGLSAITVPWETLFLSVALYIVVPVILAQVLRTRLMASGGEEALQRALKRLGPASLVVLLATLVLLFGFQDEQITRQPLILALLAVPILIQVCFNPGLAYLLNRAFGFESGATLATVVGVPVEAPAMLSVVRIVNRTKAWYERM